MKEITVQEAFNKMAAYCSSTEHCKSEVADKLSKWELNTEVTERILAKLEEENYLNEERYCQSFIHDKFRFNKWGKVKIAQALRQKKIPNQFIYTYLDKIDKEAYSALLKKLLEEKRKTVRAKNEYDLKGKLIRYALTRGFSMEDISQCISLPE